MVIDTFGEGFGEENGSAFRGRAMSWIRVGACALLAVSLSLACGGQDKEKQRVSFKKVKRMQAEGQFLMSLVPFQFGQFTYKPLVGIQVHQFFKSIIFFVGKYF